MTPSRLKAGLYRRINYALPISWTTTQQLGEEDPRCWMELLPSCDSAWLPELGSGPVPPELAAHLPPRLESKGLLSLENAWVCSRDGWVFDAHSRRVLNLSGFHQLHHQAPRVRLPLGKFRAPWLGGTTLSLLSTWGTQNFYHFVFDVLSRLAFLKRASVSWKDVDRVLLPDFSSPTALRMVEDSGIPLGKIHRVSYQDEFLVRCERLLCTSFPGMRRTCSKLSVDFLREKFTPCSTVSRGRRLFVTRKSHSRSLLNEPEVWSLLESHGFERLEPALVPFPEKLFSEASCVVGIHGAALANLIFCPPGTRVLELLPSDHPYPQYFSLSQHAGFVYEALVGASLHTVERSTDTQYDSNFDFEIPMDELEERLRFLRVADKGGLT